MKLPADSAPRASLEKHAIDVISLVFGVAFLAAVLWWLILRSISIDLPSFGWFVAGALIVAGLLGLVAALRPHRRLVEPPGTGDRPSP